MARIPVNPIDPATGRPRRGRPPKIFNGVSAFVPTAVENVLNEIPLGDADIDPAARLAEIKERFDVLHMLTDGVIASSVRGLIVAGAPGVGKTYTINEKLEAAQEAGLIKFQEIRGMISGIHLYKEMYNYRDPNSVLLIDDADTVFESENTLNLLKVGLDTSTVRNVSWRTEANLLKNEDIPNSFQYFGSMIFITNKNFQRIIDAGVRSHAPHMQALMSRSIYLDLKLNTKMDLKVWIRHMVESYGILIQQGVGHNEQSVILDWMDQNFADLRELSIRTVKKACSLYMTAPDKWESVAKLTLIR